MALVMASDFLGMLRQYRTLWVRGRYGGGKTSLAFRLAFELLTHPAWGYRYLLSNCESIWADSPDQVRPRLVSAGGRTSEKLDCVLLLDEAGIFLQSWADAADYLAFMRKSNLCLLMPSVTQIPARIRSFQVGRVLDMRMLNFPACVYRWRLLAGDVRETGLFVWWHPDEVNGVYDTLQAVSDDGGLGEFIRTRTGVDTQARRARRSARGGDSSPASDAFEEAASSLEMVMPELSEAAKKMARRAGGGLFGR